MNSSSKDRYSTVQSKFNQYNKKKRVQNSIEIGVKTKAIFMYFREDPSDRLAKPVFKNGTRVTNFK